MGVRDIRRATRSLRVRLGAGHRKVLAVSATVVLAIGVPFIFAQYLAQLIGTLAARRPVRVLATARGKAKVAEKDYRAWAAWQATYMVAWPLVTVGAATGTIWLVGTGCVCMIVGGIVAEGLTHDRRSFPPAH